MGKRYISRHETADQSQARIPQEPKRYISRHETADQSQVRIPMQYQGGLLDNDERGEIRKSNKRRDICYEFQSNGQCDRGDKCRFFHDEVSRNSNTEGVGIFQKAL